jgi:hypothetical protein
MAGGSALEKRRHEGNEKIKTPSKSHLLDFPVFGRSGSYWKFVFHSISSSKSFRELNYAYCEILGFKIVQTPEIGRFYKLPY